MGLTHPAVLSLVAASAIGLVRFVAARKPSLLTVESAWAVRAVVAGAVVGALLADAAPTATGPVDALFRGLFAAGTTLAASKSRRWAWVVAAGLGAAVARGFGHQVLAFVTLGVAIGGASSRRRGPVFGAVVGAALAQVLLRLGSTGFHGLTALAAAVAFVALGLSYWLQAGKSRRLRLRHRLLSAVLVSGLVLAAYGTALLMARPGMIVGVRAAEQGLAAERAGRSAEAAELLTIASQQLAEAERHLGSWLARPARLLPVVSQHARALEEVVTAASAIARPGSEAARVLGSRRPTTAVAIDVEWVAQLQPSLEASVAALERAVPVVPSVRSDWLAPALTRRLDKADSLFRRALEDGRTAAQVARLVPEVLGRGSPRRYFLAIQNPAEQRASGGIIGAFGELTAEEGRLSLPVVGRISDLYEPGGAVTRALSGPADFIRRYQGFGPERFFTNASLSPDFPTVARVIEELYPQAGGPAVDGVVSIDPIGLAALLQLSGPVTVAGWPEPITGTNAAQVLLHDQYVRLVGQPREEFTIAVARAAFERLGAVPLPTPGEVARVLGPAVRGKHLLLQSTRSTEQRLFERIGAAGAVPPVRHDYLHVIGQNNGQSKIDWFQRRAVSYAVRYDPATGETTSTMRARLTNQAPATGLPDYVITGEQNVTGPGQSRVWVSVYSPLGLDGATLDGQPTALEEETELGRRVYSGFVLLEPGQSRVLELKLSGVLPAGRTYHLDVGRQATITPDELSVSVSAPVPWAVDSAMGMKDMGKAAQAQIVQKADQRFTARFGLSE